MKDALIILCLLMLSACSRSESDVDEKSLAATAAQLDQKANEDVNRMINAIDAEAQEEMPPTPADDSTKIGGSSAKN